MDNQRPETIRQWYRRSTRRAWRIFLIASAISSLIMLGMWTMAKFETLHRLQLFNGALTIPLWGGLWIFAFVFLFLAPSREVGFRGQETLDSLRESMVPVIDIWKRIGLQVEGELPGLLKSVKETVIELKEASKKIETAVTENGALVKDARPVIESLQRIEKKVEEHMLVDLENALEAVQRMAPLPANAPVGMGKKEPSATAGAKEDPEKASSEPNLSIALSSIRKKKAELKS